MPKGYTRVGSLSVGRSSAYSTPRCRSSYYAPRSTCYSTPPCYSSFNTFSPWRWSATPWYYDRTPQTNIIINDPNQQGATTVITSGSNAANQTAKALLVFFGVIGTIAFFNVPICAPYCPNYNVNCNKPVEICQTAFEKFLEFFF